MRPRHTVLIRFINPAGQNRADMELSFGESYHANAITTLARQLECADEVRSVEVVFAKETARW